MRSQVPLRITLTRFCALPVSAGGMKPVFEFHILAAARDRYRFDQELFSISGNVILPDFRAARVFAQKMNALREAGQPPAPAVKAGHINAMGLIDEILHYVLRLYEESANPGVFSRALAHLEKKAGKANVRNALLKFGALFPPRDVFTGTKELKTFLTGTTGGKPHAEILLEELILLHVANINPAFDPFKELFDDTELSRGSQYQAFPSALEEFFRTEKRFGPENQYIFDLLRAPILASPRSLEGQLDFIKRRWGLMLSERFLTKLLGAGDLLREEEKVVFPQGGARTPLVVPQYPRWDAAGSDRPDPERFTADLDWMPRIVILAKNMHVWLDQMSKKYRRSISRLDQIPDEELDQLARWNITGLWLIGIWERSPASQKIKQATGNPEAVSSAYSIYDYDIAAELGGEGAFLNLRHRAWQRGIRMAGDMVPNHMGIYSKWIVEHPDYFIQSEYSPFPNYRFTGSNLSGHPDVDIRIEDGYWTRRDAAVVFRRVDTRTGHTRHIYHGNDGTNMPWNDTAQLDFLKADVREAVIQTILHVARKFSIIRFDAAMTLARRHFQRLWYPPPGSGGDIPSRADHAIRGEDFDRAFPLEFWREVVDRINSEMPETLLLAEAFWLLEGYFVRSLGMHRVYNSAFMHMLMREENAKYRALIRNTLAFNPEILKRYVNFMSNPDEETAIAQFGRDDKYFGVAVMMVTLPGLPMFAHGQIEGFHEKYGMEYKRAYYDETADEELIRRHERELFPLMRERRLFSHVGNFELYDLAGEDGTINENVFAYSNMDGEARALICYHNKYEECSGWVRTTAPKVESPAGDGEKRLMTKGLGDALKLDSGDRVYYVFRDRKSGLEFIRSGRELCERGLFVHLHAFQYQVFMDFGKVHDETGEYALLAAELNGAGVFSVRDALTDRRLRPVHDAFIPLFDTGALEGLRALCSEQATGQWRTLPEGLRPLIDRYAGFLHAVSGFLGSGVDGAAPATELREDIERLRFIVETSRPARPPSKGRSKVLQREVFPDVLRPLGTPAGPAILLAWLLTGKLGRLLSAGDVPRQSAELFDRLKLDSPLRSVIGEDVPSGADVGQTVERLKVLIRFQEAFAHNTEREIFHAVRDMLDDACVRIDLRVNLYDEVLYYNRESFETLTDWLFLIGSLNKLRRERGAPAADRTGPHSAHLLKIRKLSDRSGYRLAELRNLLSVPDHLIDEEPLSR